nr:MetaGeneMark_Unknown Function [uncultured bacterium]
MMVRYAEIVDANENGIGKTDAVS